MGERVQTREGTKMLGKADFNSVGNPRKPASITQLRTNSRGKGNLKILIQVKCYVEINIESKMNSKARLQGDLRGKEARRGAMQDLLWLHTWKLSTIYF